MQLLQAKVQEHEICYSSLQADKNNLRKDFEELMTKFHSAADELDKYKEKYDSVQNNLAIVKQDFQTQSEKHKFEV